MQNFPMTSNLTEGPLFGSRSHKLSELGRLGVKKPMMCFLSDGVFANRKMPGRRETQAEMCVKQILQ